MKRLPQYVLVPLVAIGTATVVFCLMKTRSPALVPPQSRSIAQLVDLSADSSNVNRVQDAIFLLWQEEGLRTQKEFAEKFASFDFEPNAEHLIGAPPMDFERCTHVSVLLLKQWGPPPTRRDVAAGLTRWYLTAAFDKKNGLRQWWAIWQFP